LPPLADQEEEEFKQGEADLFFKTFTEKID
jgi:hypothetical protein